MNCYENFRPSSANERVAYSRGFYPDPWGIWVHKDNPDGDGYTLKELVQNKDPNASTK